MSCSSWDTYWTDGTGIRRETGLTYVAVYMSLIIKAVWRPHNLGWIFLGPTTPQNRDIRSGKVLRKQLNNVPRAHKRARNSAYLCYFTQLSFLNLPSYAMQTFSSSLHAILIFRHISSLLLFSGRHAALHSWNTYRLLCSFLHTPLLPKLFPASRPFLHSCSSKFLKAFPNSCSISRPLFSLPAFYTATSIK